MQLIGQVKDLSPCFVRNLKINKIDLMENLQTERKHNYMKNSNNIGKGTSTPRFKEEEALKDEEGEGRNRIIK